MIAAVEDPFCFSVDVEHVYIQCEEVYLWFALSLPVQVHDFIHPLSANNGVLGR